MGMGSGRNATKQAGGGPACGRREGRQATALTVSGDLQPDQVCSMSVGEALHSKVHFTFASASCAAPVSLLGGGRP